LTAATGSATAASATATAATTATAAATASAATTSETSRHTQSLLHSMAAPPTAWQEERRATQFTSCIGAEHVFYVPADETDNRNAGGNERRFQNSRNGAANENVDAGGCAFTSSGQRISPSKPAVFTSGLPAVLDVDHG